MKKLLQSLIIGLLAAPLVAWAITPLAAAHVLKQDNGISAVLHIPPEDNPEAAQPTELELAFGDDGGKFSLPNCDCGVVVTRGSQTVQTVALHPVGQSRLNATATVRFPSIGVYHVLIEGSAKDGAFGAFKLDYLERVPVSAAVPPTGNTAGANVLIIGAGSLIALGMFAYDAIGRGGRYKAKRNPS